MSGILFYARVVGIEPTQEVLETSVLPLYDTRITLGDEQNSPPGCLFGFFVWSMFFTMHAKLTKFKPIFKSFFVLS